LIVKKPKLKKCRQCKKEFTPFKTTQVVCSQACAKAYGKKQTTKQLNADTRREKKQTREKLLALKPKSYWLQKAQFQFNKYIRLRDGNNPCISCDRHHTGQYHAGHYRSVGSAPHLRFDERNCHRQCSVCNNHLSGNQIEYRKGLIRILGEGGVAELEGDHSPKHYTIEEIKQIERHYKEKIKGLQD